MPWYRSLPSLLGTSLFLLIEGCGPSELVKRAVPDEVSAEAYLAVPGKDPIGFGVAGVHTRDWKTDGRAWTYNWGANPPAAQVAAPGALYLPMIWGGPFCGQWGDLRAGVLEQVPRYRDTFCTDRRCRIDAREVFVDGDGVNREVVISSGRRYDWANGALRSSQDLTSVVRYCGAKSSLGVCTGVDRPCFGKKWGECRFETLAIARVGAERWESISAYGRYFNFELATGAFRGSASLTSVKRYCGEMNAEGVCQGTQLPCYGKKGNECSFDSRTFTRDYESITAYGKYFNYLPGKQDAFAGSARLETVDRYRYGACRGASATSPCTFDSRTLGEAVGQPSLESITGVPPQPAPGEEGLGRYYLWWESWAGPYCAPGDPSLQDYLAKVEEQRLKFPGPEQRWLIFNEPDMGGQANLPPEHAAEVYVAVTNQIRARDPNARFYCCGTVPRECNTPDCANWMRRFAGALAGRAPVHAIHYHNYATTPGFPLFFSPGGAAVIAGMKAFSDELQTIPGLENRPIVVTEWSGLTPDLGLRCGPGINNRDDMLTPVAAWLTGEGRTRYRYQAAAWFMDYCTTGRNCSVGAILYESQDPQPHLWDCGENCRKTCLGEKYFRDIIPSWNQAPR